MHAPAREAAGQHPEAQRLHHGGRDKPTFQRLSRRKAPPDLAKRGKVIAGDGHMADRNQPKRGPQRPNRGRRQRRADRGGVQFRQSRAHQERGAPISATTPGARTAAPR
jgi:hypothetical protein